jgi:hypothetical protein
MARPNGNGNGNGIPAAWRTWALGIAGTVVVTLITNGILFQRETKEKLATIEARLNGIETRGRDAIIREFQRIEKRLDKIESDAQPKPGYKLQSEESRPFDPEEFKR